MSAETIIQNFADTHGCLVGICDSTPFHFLHDQLTRKKVPFTTPDIQKRIDPSLTMPNVNSIIVIGVNYHKKLAMPSDDSVLPSVPRGALSMVAVGIDYHIVVTSLLKQLATTLYAYKPFDYQIFCDTGPLVDRAVAKRAGLGFIGRNHSVISKRFGSLFSIGYMLTSLPLDSALTNENDNAPPGDLCGDCRRCIECCPTRALSVDDLCYERCLSYLTQCKADILPSLQQKMGVTLYGCDICTSVCPHNAATPFEEITDIEWMHPQLDPFLALSNRTFKEKYGDSAFFWRGKNVLQRNARIAKENQRQGGDP